MCCEKYKQDIGRFLDDELTPDARSEVSEHLQTCSPCSLELASLRELAAEISDAGEVRVPSGLWETIERRLSTGAERHTDRAAPRFGVPRSSRWANRWTVAASLVFAAGLGVFGLSRMDSAARASTINFGVLLDALPLDAPNAFRKFLVLYDARPGSSLDARQFAPSLDFDTPPTLPGGFRLDGVHLLRFGDRPGVAASYRRGGDFLAIIFHAPVENENFGTHKDYPCVVGKHHGHKVEVGSWRMVHFTDSTTCHCVLSQLDEASELPAVMLAIAPSASGHSGGGAHGHHHP